MKLDQIKSKKKKLNQIKKTKSRKLTLEVGPQLGKTIFHVLLGFSELLLGDGQGFRSREFQIQLERHRFSPAYLFPRVSYFDRWLKRTRRLRRYDETILIAGRPQYICDLIYLAREEGGLLFCPPSRSNLWPLKVQSVRSCGSISWLFYRSISLLAYTVYTLAEDKKACSCMRRLIKSSLRNA